MRQLVCSIIWLFIVFVTTAKGAAKKQSCYVCIPNTGLSIQDVLVLFPSGPTIPLCNQFKPGQQKFKRDCPNDNYVGCSTMINGTHVTKSCSLIGVNDCQTANNISYCYCHGSNCNAEEVPEEEPRPPVEATPHHNPDDEDSSEASGYSSIEDSETNSRIPQVEDDIKLEEDSKKVSERPHQSPPKNIAGSASSTTTIPLFTLVIASMVFVININKGF